MNQEEKILSNPKNSYVDMVFKKSMPDEVLMEVFMYLSVPELLRSVAFVSRRFWTMLLHDDIVWNRKLVVLTTSRDPFQKTHQDATTLMRMNRHQIQRFCWHAEYQQQQQRNARPIMFGSTSDSLAASTRRRRPLPDFLKDGQLLVRRRDATSLLHGGYYYYTPYYSKKKSGTHRRSLPVRRYVCLASTTDHTHERIENVLNDSSIRTASPIRNNTNLRRPITEEEYWENTIRRNSVKNNHDQNNETTTTTRASLEFRNTTTTTTAMLFSYSQQPWWSSVSREDPNSDETLIFSTRYPLCSISEIAIKPYTDWMETVYTWKHLGIQIYNLPVLSSTTSTVVAEDGESENEGEEEVTLKHLLPSEIGNYGDTYEGASSDTTTTAGRRLQATAAAPATTTTTEEEGGGMEQHPHFGNKSLLDYLARQTPVYEHYNNTPPTPKDNSWQYHKLPIGIIGNVVVFQLMGKNFRQFDNTGYYACVQSVEVRGIPLYESPQPQPQPTNMATTTTELDDTTTTTANSFEMQRRETRRDIAIRRDLEIVPLFIQNS